MVRHSPPLVAHVIYALTMGGLENGLVNIINRTPTSRYRNVIICITIADDFARRITLEGVRVIQLHKREGHDFGFYWRLWRLFRELRPDIIHSRNLAALETQFLSIGCRGVRRVHGEHGLEGTDLGGGNWKYLAFRRFMRLFIHRYIVVSKDLSRWLEARVKVLPRNIRQIYNGVDHTRFGPARDATGHLLPWESGKTPEMIVIGTVGRLSPVKDQRSLLFAVAKLREIAPGLYPRLRLVIVGEGPLRQSLTDLVNELGLEQICWLPGDRDDVPALLAAMDVFVLTSLREGIPNTVLEAMASALPVIATAVGGNLELVEEGFNGSLVPAENPEALANALVPLLENQAERKRQGANARQRVCQRFDWSRTVDAYLSVYDEVLQLPAHASVEGAG
jgi:sugar transferase (PEP-CTERM/EpsH1 system associated)